MSPTFTVSCTCEDGLGNLERSSGSSALLFFLDSLVLVDSFLFDNSEN